MKSSSSQSDPQPPAPRPTQAQYVIPNKRGGPVYVSRGKEYVDRDINGLGEIQMKASDGKVYKRFIIVYETTTDETDPTFTVLIAQLSPGNLLKYVPAGNEVLRLSWMSPTLENAITLPGYMRWKFYWCNGGKIEFTRIRDHEDFVFINSGIKNTKEWIESIARTEMHYSIDPEDFKKNVDPEKLRTYKDDKHAGFDTPCGCPIHRK